MRKIHNNTGHSDREIQMVLKAAFLRVCFSPRCHNDTEISAYRSGHDRTYSHYPTGSMTSSLVSFHVAPHAKSFTTAAVWTTIRLDTSMAMIVNSQTAWA